MIVASPVREGHLLIQACVRGESTRRTVSLLAHLRVGPVDLRVVQSVPCRGERDADLGNELFLRVKDVVLAVLKIADVLGRLEAVDVVRVLVSLLSQLMVQGEEHRRVLLVSPRRCSGLTLDWHVDVLNGFARHDGSWHPGQLVVQVSLAILTESARHVCFLVGGEVDGSSHTNLGRLCTDVLVDGRMEEV